ncbi:MAG: ATP-binding protein [Spirochaetaceae bacterium]
MITNRLFIKNLIIINYFLLLSFNIFSGDINQIAKENLIFDTVYELSEMCEGGLIKDNEGFLWISTQNGLYRFDGLTTEYRGGKYLSSRITTSILIDSEGLIWIGTKGGGLNKYDKWQDSFTSYKHDTENPQSISSDYLPLIGQQLLLEDNEGYIWIATEEGLNRLDKKNEIFTHYFHNANKANSLSSNRISALYQDREGIIWIGTFDSGLNRYDPGEKIFKHFKNDSRDLKSLSDNYILSIFEDSSGRLWIGTDGGGLNYFDRTNETFINYMPSEDDSNSIGDDNIYTILEDRDGWLWLGHHLGDKTGLTLFNPDTDHFISYGHDEHNSHSITTNSITDFWQEEDTGIIWILNHFGIIQKYDPESRKIQLHRHDPVNPFSISDNMVLPLLFDRNNDLWIGTISGGLNKMDLETDRFYSFMPNEDNPQRTVFSGAVLEDSDGEFWLGNMEASISKYDPLTNTVLEKYSYNPDNPSSIADTSMVTSIIEDEENKGIFWMASFATGLFSKFDKSKGVFTNYPALSSISMIFDDGQGDILIASQGHGLVKFNKNSEQYHYYKHDEENIQSISGDIVWGIFKDSKNRIWVGMEQGISLFEEKSGTFKNYNPNTGYEIYQGSNFLEDKKGNIWISGNQITKFNPESESVKIYTSTDGSQIGVFFRESAAIAPDGRMFFGGSEGLNSFYPEKLKDNPYIPPIVLTSFKQGGNILDLGTAPEIVEEIILDWKVNFFEFEFASLNFTKPENNNYAYMLEGWDNNWYYSNSIRSGRYSGLKPGSYILKLKGTNNDGLWNEVGTSVNIVITTPFWQRWWFISISIILITGLLFSMVFLRIRSIELKKIKLEKQVDIRTKELKSAIEEADLAKEKAEVANKAKSMFLSKMSHELRTPLNGILGYSKILMRDKNIIHRQYEGLNIIYQSGTHLLTLINDILDLAKIEAGKIELEFADVLFPEFLQNIVDLMSLSASAKSLDFQYDIPEKLPEGIYTDRKKLRQILINLLGNAIKFTDSGIILFRISVISFEEVDSNKYVHLRFEVKDSGKGIPKKQLKSIFLPFEQAGDQTSRAEGTGLGLTISQQLIKSFGSQLNVESVEGTGSSFWFDIKTPIVTFPKNAAPKKEKRISGYEGSELRILVVDDNYNNRAVLVNILEPMGFKLFSAKDGQLAIDLLMREQIDLVLTDIIMPVKSGYELVKDIRNTEDLKMIPVIAVSASVMEEEKDHCLDVGCDDFINKPVDERVLFDILAKHLHLHWIYETIEDHQNEKIKLKDLHTSLSKEDLKSLLVCAKLGDMEEIKKIAIKLSSKDSGDIFFLNGIINLAGKYEVNKVRKLLEDVIGEMYE